ncbi:hypothetical protein LTR09_002526 [Extremus antarcticus]|uniref:PH domain-containing protein n=1 Tax=Extremus antarcticus TaxID=702011 RepID=A0AAJ0GFX8_9PEZI|nr:hypothetical protein LTR09_002526 [Extremus antarcticus]
MSRLPPDSYTSRRLEHATPEHIHLTTRRAFIGPIPEGWLNSHRKQWYRYYVQQGGKRAPTFTAAQSVAADDDTTQEADRPLAEQVPRPSSQSAETQQTQQTQTGTGMATTSTTSLLRSQRNSAISAVSDRAVYSPTEQNGSATEGHATIDSVQQDGGMQQRPSDLLNPTRVASNMKLQAPKVRFSEATKLQFRSRAQRIAAMGNFKMSKIKPGELMKMDKMLVRIDITQQTIREDYDERVSRGVETKSLDKWREFMVVCRKHEQGAVLQLYQTRVIAAMADKTKKKPKAEIILSQHKAKVNMFSSLDKTLCIWTQEKNRTYIYYLRPQSGAASVEWYTFLRTVLGLARSTTLQVNVPDLSVSLRLDDPFRALESSEALRDAAAGDEEAIAKAVSDEQGAAGAIVARCLDMLKQSPQWGDVVKGWAKNDRIGLAWKRYDRLEWVHGAVEQKMYGTIAMQRTHDLELRPKDHYPSQAKSKKGNIVEEPAPVEGFLVRLTTQKGHSKRMGKMLFKRLYFTSQNQYLVFLRPARAKPPPPPKMKVKKDGDAPSKQQLIDETPIYYDVDPFPLDNDGQVAWLDTEGVKSTSELAAYDREASIEAARNTDMLMVCDGFIDMGDIARVRKFHKGANPLDDNLDSGSDVDFEEATSNNNRNDGNTNQLDESRTLELLLNNGLVIRLQAYNQQSRTVWISRLRQLVKYWHHRAKEDMDLIKSVREQNLHALQIDERAEAQVGSFAYKWEVSQSYASPLMYNLCGISYCRPIHMSGLLFRKPRRHTTFTRCHVILSAGHLLIFQDTLRKRGSGQKLVHIHHERIGSVDLTGCYLYSGLLTENDLLYQNQTFDSNAPGHHALPRIYLEDGWTSTDEDAMTTFVLWHAKSKSWFRSSHFVDDVKSRERSKSIGADGEVDSGTRAKTKTKLTRVSQLGVTGRSVVFKARSRAERDRWVLGIQVEIERLAAQAQREEGEEVRLDE